MRVNDLKDKLDIQGRFEQLPNNIHGEVKATQLTSIAGKYDKNLGILFLKIL